MDLDRFESELAALRQRVVGLHDQSADVPVHHVALQQLALAELNTRLEELHTAAEELRAQNQELLATRQALEAERQRYQDLFENAPDAYLVTTPAGIIESANRAAAALLNRTPQVVVGVPLANFVPHEDQRRFRDELSQVRQRGRRAEWDVRLQPYKGKPINVAVTVTLVSDPAGHGAALRWLLRDITARKRVEEDLKARARQQAALAELGQRALATPDLSTLMNEASALVTQTLNVERCKILQLLPESNALLLRAGVGWEEVLQEHGVVSTMSVAIEGHERPFGVLQANTSRRRRFTEDDVHFLQAVANVLATAIERTRAEEMARSSQTEAEHSAEPDRLRHDEVAPVSDDLRTPLPTARAQLGLETSIVDRLRSDEQQLLGKIRHNLERLRSLILRYRGQPDRSQRNGMGSEHTHVNDHALDMRRTALPEGDGQASVRYPVIDAQGLQKDFGGPPVLSDLSLQVGQGEIFGLIGPSGSGKTTMIHLLCGHLRPSSGAVTVLGERPAHFTPATRRRIGYMPQTFILYPDLTVEQNISFAAGLYGLSEWHCHERIQATLELVELWEARKRTVRAVSGGMQRRLALAAALVHDPDLLFADEPTANLDPILRAKLWRHFRSLCDHGRTLLITTQYIDEAEYCDRVGLMFDGALIADGRPEDLRRRAFGGDIVDIIIERPSPGYVEAVSTVSGVRATEVPRAEALRVTVEDAQRAIPILLDALISSGAEVRSVAQYRPTFDEVFIRLIEQHGGSRPPVGRLKTSGAEEG